MDMLRSPLPNSLRLGSDRALGSVLYVGVPFYLTLTAHVDLDVTVEDVV